MAGKYLYYDKYLKYKNKYLDLKGQIGGDAWTITIVSDTYIATKTKNSIIYTISVKYTKNKYNEIILDIKINSNDRNIDIEFKIDYSTSDTKIIKRKIIGTEIFKSDDDLITQLKSAITTILTEKNQQSIETTIIESVVAVLE